MTLSCNSDEKVRKNINIQLQVFRLSVSIYMFLNERSISGVITNNFTMYNIQSKNESSVKPTRSISIDIRMLSMSAFI